MFRRALGRKRPPQSYNQLRCSCRHPRRSSGSYVRVSVLQPGGSGDTSVDTVDTEPHLDALTQHVAGRLAVPGASAAAEEVLMDSGSAIAAISEELVEPLRRQPGMMQNA